MGGRAARRGVLALVTLVLAALTGCASGDGDARDAATQLPRTPFEQRGGEPWTTLEEERRFLRELDRRSERVRVAEIGTSGDGRALRLVVVGPPRTRVEIAAGSSALFVCTQHGDEPAGREACLQRLRDHAAGDDASSLLFIPTANPDGVAAGTRFNASGADVNRDHLELGTPEARFIAGVFRSYQPDVLGDMHEYRRSGADSVLFQPPDRVHPNADRAVGELSGTAVTRYLAPALDASGFRTGDYVSGGVPDPGVLLPMAGLRHTAAALVETPRRGSLSPARRVAAQRTAIAALARMLRERAAQLRAGTGGSRRRAASAGGARAASGSAGGFAGDDPGPCGYGLSETQYDQVRGTLALQGVRAVRAGTSWVVPLAQPARPVVPLLLDPDAPAELTAARPVPC